MSAEWESIHSGHESEILSAAFVLYESESLVELDQSIAGRSSVVLVLFPGG